METKTYTVDFAGKKLFVELGRFAQQANGSCRIQYGETTILVTATMSPHAKDTDFFPLKVDYEERYYAAGKIKGSKWIKREGKPSDEAVLTRRLIDRPLRPRFNQAIRNEVQVVATVLTFDGINDPDVPSIFGASLALMVSDIPFNGPVGAIRIGRVEGKLVFNPTYEERTKSDFDIVIAATEDRVNMIEAGANIIPEQEVVDAIGAGFKELQHIIQLQQKIAKELDIKKKELAMPVRDEALVKIVKEYVDPELEKVLYTPHKQAYVEGLHRLSDMLQGHITETFIEHPELHKKLKEAKVIFEEEIDFILSKNILKEEKRPDGRKLDELRKLTTDVAILPHSHGSGLFERGSTQVLSVLTLASPGMAQWIETMETELTQKHFMHHYVFPPFSVGEVGRVGFPGGREIGHGALAERALEPILPTRDTFPYTIRVVSEVLSSNGSSSMASVCASTLAMMDGGVPIKTPAAGIAMGIITDDNDPSKYKILTDIQGPEDHHGDMDLKVAGTKDGITALQMDVKIDGIDTKILGEAFAQAKKARLEILEKITEALSVPRTTLSPFAPRIEMMKINPEKIGKVIGSQGKVINEIIATTGATIDIEDDGSVFITGETDESIKKAVQKIKDLTFEAKAGDEFTGKVTRIFDFGAMVEFMPGQEGLVHVSEISKERIKHPADVLKMGQQVTVRVKNIDDYGRINLTMKS